TVKLPEADLEGALEALAGLAREWRLDEDAIASWAARAASATTGSHAYSTRVFAAQPAGFVRLELQVEHHVEQDRYVVDALFSWTASPGSTSPHTLQHAADGVRLAASSSQRRLAVSFRP